MGSEPEPYFNPDDPEDPGPFEEGFAVQKRLLEAKVAVRDSHPLMNKRLLRQIEKSGALKIPPETIERVNELAGSQVGKIASETMRKLEAMGPQLDPAFTRKIAQMTRDFEKVRPVRFPHRIAAPVLTPTPVRVVEPVELEPLGEVAPLKWYQHPYWAFTATVVTTAGFPLTVATFLILIL